MARSRSISARAEANAACSGETPGRPGTAAANASIAARLAVRQIVTTVERSTPNRSAASRCVACPVRTEVNNSHFSLGDNRRRLPVRMLGSDTIPSLQFGQTRRLLAGYFSDPLLHSVRRKAKTGVLVAAGGALLIGGANAIIAFFSGLGAGIH